MTRSAGEPRQSRTKSSIRWRERASPLLVQSGAWEASRFNRVIIAGSRDATTLEIPWDSRQALLEWLRRDEDTEPIFAAPQAVGRRGP